MDYSTFLLVLCLILAIGEVFLIVWVLKSWPNKKDLKEHDEKIESNLRDFEKRILEMRTDGENKLKEFQLNYEERMMKFKTDYENGLNGFQEDYADSYSAISKKFAELQNNMEAFTKEVKHNLTEYSSKYYYLENKFKEGLKNEKYEANIEKVETKLAKVEKKLSSHRHPAKAATTKKTATKKSTTRSKKVSAKNKDNLQLITGIGKVLEGALNKQKVYTFKQIADMSKDDIELISKKVQGFGDKLKKYKWVKQAKSLYKKNIKK